MKKTIRHQAVDILDQVSKHRRFAGDLLDIYLEKQDLSQTSDGRLLTHLVYGVLRQQGLLDWILSRLYRGRFPKMEETVKNILRTGLYQLKFSDRLPPFAVVDEAVKIAKKKSPALGGLVNAVLRRYLRDAEKMTVPSPHDNPIEHIAISHSHPVWLVKSWVDIYGLDETIALCRANNEQPPTTLRVNTLKISRNDLVEKLRQQGFACAPCRFSPDGVNITDAPSVIQKTAFFKDGLLRLQDEAAQLVSYLAAPFAGGTFLDACAGTGGKTGHMAALMKNQGCIVALDKDSEKLERLSQESIRVGATIIETKKADLRQPLPKDFSNRFDAVIVDAPCSGTGTLRRNPEIKWRLQPDDIDMYATNQLILLSHAAQAVKKGGRLIYCTCSILPAENDDVLRRFAVTHPEYVLEKPPMSVPAHTTDRRGFFRMYPHRHATDGFFGAVLKRRN